MDIRVENISKQFERYPALNDVSLHIRSGELIALLGPSGSGKTTLLRTIAGLEFPTTGRILFGDEDASRMSIQKRHVGFVFQHYALFKHMTVAGNIGFGLRMRRRHRPSRRQIAGRVDELLRLIQLDGLGDRFPAQLSGGQRQRVALARALAIEPRVLLLDEPFGALDAKVRKDLRQWLRQLHDQTGHTTVFVTHDQEEALELADRVAILNDGRIEQVGSPDDIYDAPATAFVHDFIGESSRLPVTVRDGEILHGGLPTGLSSDSIGPGDLYFRPNHVEILEHDAPAGITGIVVASRRLADTRHLELEAGPERQRIEITLPLGHALAEAQRITFRPSQWHIYPSPAANPAAGPIRHE
jgi:sulfate/thiosulfate transport system ATP-binding protein